MSLVILRSRVTREEWGSEDRRGELITNKDENSENTNSIIIREI